VAKLFVKLNVRLSTLLHTKLKEKTTSIILMITNNKKKSPPSTTAKTK